MRVLFVILLMGFLPCEGKIVVTDSVIQGGVLCYKIETPAATYLFDKDGGGMASMIDRDGNDWISFDKNQKGALGEFRGIPNAVHGQDVSCFHPLNKGTSPSITTITFAGKQRVRLTTRCGNWQASWNFYPTFCSFTLDSMTLDKKYWVLYEGTPGGKTEPEKSWFIQSDGQKFSCTTAVKSDLPDPEWVAFGHDDYKRVLLLQNFDGGSEPDSYYWMGTMTVFGFGRGTTYKDKKFTSVPRTFSFGFVESTDFGKIHKKALKFRKL